MVNLRSVLRAWIILLGPAAGCVGLTSCAGGRETTFTHLSRSIALTPAAPRDERLRIQLIRVEADGTAVIHVDRTGETLAARPPGHFLGAYGGPYDVRTFGEHGLQLVASDPATQTAEVVARWAE